MSRRFMLDRPLKELRNVKKSPGKFCHRIFCPGIKQGQKSWNFLLRQEKILEFSQKNISRIPGKNGIPGIFWSQNFPILERSVWKFSVLGFCLTEYSGIRKSTPKNKTNAFQYSVFTYVHLRMQKGKYRSTSKSVYRILTQIRQG